MVQLWTAWASPEEDRSAMLRRIPEWPEIQHFACELFRHPSFDAATLERLIAWLQAEHSLPRNGALGKPLPEVISLLRHEIGERQPAPQPPPQPIHILASIISLGERCYRIGDTTVQVTEVEDNVLLAFFVLPAMDHTTLITKSGQDRAPAILRKLRTQYDGILGPAIKLPGARGKGGYSVQIRANTGS